MITIYHNPQCSKSCQTYDLIQKLNNNNESITLISYLESPPTYSTLQTLHQQLGQDVRVMIRFKENRAQTLGLSPDDERSDEQWLGILAENPILLERPIVVRGNKAVLGRPPENVENLF